jgi:hypothetical protein
MVKGGGLALYGRAGGSYFRKFYTDYNIDKTVLCDTVDD